MKKLAATIALSFAAVLMLAAPAMAYPKGNPTGTLSVSSGPPGSSVTVSGQNWGPNSSATISFQPGATTLGTAPVGVNGTFSISVTIPSSASVGAHTIQIDGFNVAGAPATVDLAFTVTGGSGGGLAFTGANISLGMLLVIVLAVIGVGALVTGRRRRVGPKETRETADR